MILSIDVCLDPMPMRVAFLGPEGTYGERAARSLMKLEDIEKPSAGGVFGASVCGGTCC
mgnify:CR=1 FL=1